VVLCGREGVYYKLSVNFSVNVNEFSKAHKLLPQVASKDEIRATLHSIVSALPLGWSPAVRKSFGFKGHLSTAPSRTSRSGLASLLLFLFHSSRISRAVFRVPMRASSATGVVRIQLRLHRVA